MRIDYGNSADMVVKEKIKKGDVYSLRLLWIKHWRVVVRECTKDFYDEIKVGDLVEYHWTANACGHITKSLFMGPKKGGI